MLRTKSIVDDGYKDIYEHQLGLQKTVVDLLNKYDPENRLAVTRFFGSKRSKQKEIS